MSQPRFEFYEYDIQDYDYNVRSFISFTDFRRRKNVDPDNKRIKAHKPTPTTYDVLYKHLEASIDPLVSLEKRNQEINYPENISKSELNLTEFLNVYRTYGPRKNINRRFYSVTRQRKIIDSINRATDINKSYIDSVIDTSSLLIDDIHNGAFIFKINASPDEKMICFGDFHGSFHTFLRNIFRLYVLGILDLSNGQYKINDGYRLIFLGDIVDRGDYGLEIIYIISQFIIQNNTPNHLKIIVNRGNHEEYKTYQRYGFEKEYKNKIGNQMNLFKRFFSYLSSAIVLEQNGSRYWMSHGGIPFTNTGYLNPSFGSVFDTHRLFQTHSIAFIRNTPGADKFDIPFQIRWNDFHLASNTVINNRRGDVGFKIGTNYLQEFLRLNNIQMIIRGHNDNYFNSFIFCRNPNYVVYNKTSALPSDPDYDSIIYPLSKVPITPGTVIPPLYDSIVETNPNINQFLHKQPISTFTNTSFNQSNGAVAMIDPLNLRGNPLDINNYIFYPVITISTNTDIERFLTRDSFMLLHQLSPQNQANQSYTGLFKKRYIMNRINQTLPLNFTNVIRPNRLAATQRTSFSSTSSLSSSLLPPPPSGIQLTTLSRTRTSRQIQSHYPIDIDCKNMDTQLPYFIENNDPKERAAVLFYLKKGLCFGIFKGSRRIVKEYDSQGQAIVTFYQDSSTHTTISMEIYKELIHLTPFISYKIIYKLYHIQPSLKQNLTKSNINKFKFRLLISFIDKIPSISRYYKLKDIFSKLYRTFIKIDLEQINKQKLKNNIDAMIDIYNYICFYLFYYESKSFMKSIGFVSNRNTINQHNLDNIFNLYMNKLPNFLQQRQSIINSLLGRDTNYIEYLIFVLDNL